MSARQGPSIESAAGAASVGEIGLDLVQAAVLGVTDEPPRSDFDLSPQLRELMPETRNLRPAAVLCPITPREDGLHVILTRRADHLKNHAGQIAFPGGKVDPEDRSPLATALREAHEEIGLVSDLVDVLGAIARYETVTGFLVTPFVGVTQPTYQPIVDDNEVAEVFEAPLDFLMNPANIQRVDRVVDGKPRPYYAIPYQDRYIWGATAAMLKNLADRIASVRAGL